METSLWMKVEEVQVKCEELAGLLDLMYWALSNGENYKYRDMAALNLLNMNEDIVDSLRSLTEEAKYYKKDVA